MAKNEEKSFMDVKDETNNFDKKDIESWKGMAVLSYIGILSLIPYLTEKKNAYVRYHAVQGLNLFILEMIYSVLYGILTSVIKVKGSCGAGYYGSLADAFGVTCNVTPWWVTVPLSIIGLGFTVLAIIGIVNACQDKAKELPIVNQIKIIKK